MAETMTGRQQLVSEVVAGLVALPIVGGTAVAAALGHHIPSAAVALSASVVAFYFGGRTIGATIVTLGNGATQKASPASPAPSAAPAPTTGGPA